MWNLYPSIGSTLGKPGDRMVEQESQFRKLQPRRHAEDSRAGSGIREAQVMRPSERGQAGPWIWKWGLAYSI